MLTTLGRASWLIGVCWLVLRAAPAMAQTVSVSESPAAFGELATSGNRLQWDEHWPRFRSIGYSASLASITGALVATLLIPYPDEPRWTGGILFDDATRHALRARSPAWRDAIRVASDITLLTTVVQTGLVDGFLIPAVDKSFDVSWQLTLINAQAFSLNFLVATLLFKAAARARPPYEQCVADREFDPFCDRGSFASFPSSHTSTAFTAAGLTCIHHANLPLYGGEPWDTAACVSSLVLATATGLFRVIGDRHYLSDVLVGAAIGFALGYVYPWLLHYRYDKDLEAVAIGDANLSLQRRQPTLPFVLSYGGTF